MEMVFRWDQASGSASEVGERRVATVDEVDAFLDELTVAARTNGIPMGTMMFADPSLLGPRLLVTVGADRVPLYWPDTDEHSRGDATTDRGPEFEFLLGIHTVFPAWSAIPAEQAREAARLFFTSGGKRPENVTWDAAADPPGVWEQNAPQHVAEAD